MNIPVIMYHSINNYKDKHPQGFLAFSIQEFEIHLKVLKQKGYVIVTLRELFKLPKEELSKRNYAVLTFDDGFYDNLSIVVDILNKYDIKATVFINTDMIEQNTKDVNYYNWGFLNKKELVKLHKTKRFDIQSHTHTHNRVFVSNKIVDFYDESKFDKYYWMVWLLYPELKREWHGDVRRFKNLLPKGLPILENDRSINQRQFKICYKELQKNMFTQNQFVTGGQLEADEEYKVRVKRDLVLPREILEELLGIKVEHVCFPGGAYNDEVLKTLNELAFKSYMLSSAFQGSVNNIVEINSTSSLKKISRISFTLDYPKFIPNRIASYISVYLKLEQFENGKLSRLLFHLLRKVRNILR